MNRLQVVRILLLVLLSAAALDGYKTAYALAQNSSGIVRKTGTLQAPATLSQSPQHRALQIEYQGGLQVPGVSHSARSICTRSGQSETICQAPKSPAKTKTEVGGLVDAHDARPGENSNDSVDIEKPVESAAGPDLPIGRQVLVGFIPAIDISDLPRPDPVRSALAMLLGTDSRTKGGLWISGDVMKAMDLLGWIAGDQSDLFYLDSGNRVGLRVELLASEAGAENLDRTQAGLVIANYVASREGLLLLTELTQGKEKYLLHIGGSALTMGGQVRVSSTMNLDNNFDTRINPRRSNGKKAPQELPPEGFDALVALNPATKWVSLRNSRIVPLESVMLHELAEARAKVALGLEYLPKDGRAGAHDVALACESLFASQRPFSGAEVTKGWIRVFSAEAQ